MTKVKLDKTPGLKTGNLGKYRKKCSANGRYSSEELLPSQHHSPSSGKSSRSSLAALRSFVRARASI